MCSQYMQGLRQGQRKQRAILQSHIGSQESEEYI